MVSSIPINAQERWMRNIHRFQLEAIEASNTRMFTTIEAIMNHCNDNIAATSQGMLGTVQTVITTVLNQAATAPPPNVGMRVPVSVMNQMTRSLNDMNQLYVIHCFHCRIP